MSKVAASVDQAVTGVTRVTPSRKRNVYMVTMLLEEISE